MGDDSVGDRPIVRYRPNLEALEAKRLLNAASMAPGGSHRVAGAEASSSPATETGQPHTASKPHETASEVARPSGLDHKPTHGYLVYRITNPDRYNNSLKPPFQQVLVQSTPPIPGQEYNILFISVRNGTAKTFDAGSGFQVKLAGQPKPTPILTGHMQWKPGEVFVFYVLTKKYYPIRNQVTSGFDFNLEGARSVSIPGPSGIFQRIQYDPNSFAHMLNTIVVSGPGNQGGIGAKFGLPNTSIYEFLSAKTNRIDFGGYF